MASPLATAPATVKTSVGTEVVILEYDDLVAGKDLTAEVARAYGENGLGICGLRGVPGLQEARNKLLPLSRQLALLPEDILAKYERPETHFCFGWSRGKEKFQGKPDTAKGSFYANPIFDDPADGDEKVRAKFPYAASKNEWPSEVEELEEAFKLVGRTAYDAAQLVVRECDKLIAASHPGHGDRLERMTYGESRMALGRLLHYYGGDNGGSWCGWHNDNSTITALVPAMLMNERTGEELKLPNTACGLYVKGRTGTIEKVAIPSDCLGLQIGEAAQIISGGLLRATPHHVKGHDPQPGEDPVCRETYALFIEPQWDCDIGPPAGVGYDRVLQDEEQDLIPPLSKRLKPNPSTQTVQYGQYLGDSFQEYYKHNNAESTPS